MEGFSKFEDGNEVYLKDQVLQHTAFHCNAIAIAIAMHCMHIVDPCFKVVGNVKIRKVGN